MKRVLFVNPSWDRYVSRRGKRYNRHWPPLDLLSCAGMLERHGIASNVFDQRIFGHEHPNVNDYDLIFVTSSPLDRWQCPNLELELLVDRVKPLPPGRTYLLGAHGTMDPEMVIRATGKAGLVREEPEIPVLKIALGEDRRSIPGLTYIENGQVISNPTQHLPPLDELAIPAYQLVDVRHYGYELLGPRLALLETSRGCPHSCTYCYLGMYPQYRLKSPERVVEEVRLLLEKTSTRNIYFIDLEFAIHRRHCEDVLDSLIDSGLKFRWCCQTRADSVDLDLLKKMKRAGCRLIHYGVETSSSRILDMVKKRLTLDEIRQAIKVTREAGIDSACFFMIGFPTETEGEIWQTIRFARELNPTYASFHVTTPYPGTDMYRTFSTAHSTEFIQETYQQALPSERLRALERQAYLKYYLRPGYLVSRFHDDPFQIWKKARLLIDFILAS